MSIQSLRCHHVELLIEKHRYRNKPKRNALIERFVFGKDTEQKTQQANRKSTESL